MDDLIGEFIAETTESLTQLGEDLAALAQNPGEPTVRRTISRLMHTIYSTCGFLGLTRLETLAGACKHRLSDAAPATAMLAPLLQEAVTRITFLLDALAQKGQEPAGDDRDLVSRLRSDASPAATEDRLSKKAALLAQPSIEREKQPASNAVTLDRAAFGQLVTMLGRLIHTRNHLQHTWRDRGDAEVTASLDALSTIIATLNEDVLKEPMEVARQTGEAMPSMTRMYQLTVGSMRFALDKDAINGVVRFDAAARAHVEITNSAPMLRLGNRKYRCFMPMNCWGSRTIKPRKMQAFSLCYKQTAARWDWSSIMWPISQNSS